jgi:uncharacterized LabA/DUF88 family protein
MAEKTAVLMDGGFVKKKLAGALHRFPTVHDVVALCSATMAKPELLGASLFRIYFYDAPPFEGTATNPIDHSILNFSGTPQARQNQALLQSLELQPNFAVRRGVLTMTGWKLGRSALKSLAGAARQITARDFVPDMGQKGVDMRIGLDIAWLSIKRIVDSVVLMTGDSDFVPVMKFARKEGVRVYMETLGHPVRRELRVHADIVL